MRVCVVSCPRSDGVVVVAPDSCASVVIFPVLLNVIVEPFRLRLCVQGAGRYVSDPAKIEEGSTNQRTYFEIASVEAREASGAIARSALSWEQ